MSSMFPHLARSNARSIVPLVMRQPGRRFDVVGLALELARHRQKDGSRALSARALGKSTAMRGMVSQQTRFALHQTRTRVGRRSSGQCRTCSKCALIGSLCFRVSLPAWMESKRRAL